MALLDYKVMVTVEGESSNERKRDESVSICLADEGQLSIRYVKYGISKLLRPEWVIPKHPSPTHDNGLLVVISGEHCGKYVRRIYHKPALNGMKNIVLAVVKRNNGVADTLTGEQFELDPETLCKVEESKAERDANKNLMTSLRKAYSKSVKK